MKQLAGHSPCLLPEDGGVSPVTSPWRTLIGEPVLEVTLPLTSHLMLQVSASLEFHMEAVTHTLHPWLKM